VREQGLGSILLDLMTRGEAIDVVTRRAVPFDIDLLADRLADAIRWISQMPELAGLQLGCFGDFTGSAATLMAATGELPIVAIVSRGGRPDLAGVHLERVRVPTLLIVGAGDAGLLSHNQEAFDRLHCEKRLEVLPGPTHRIEAEGGLDAVAHLAVQWFVEKLHLEPVAS
jgi:putative phosphoribosyl transferase